ncbi:Hypothetical protein POVR2_LOCUS29 [uncultured virus]|nr:Hypothetical protein POVR2_LOCUS29 [uncultured virus]
MHDFVLLVLVIVFIVILIVSLVYITRASVAVSGTSDPSLEQAYTYLAWTSGVLWSVIAVAIIASIALVVFGPEFLPLFGKTFIYLFLFMTIAVVIAIGVMAAIAASYIAQSPSVSKDDIKKAYDDCIIAAVITLGSIGLMLIGYYITWHTSKAASQAESTNPLETAQLLQGSNRASQLEALASLAA